MTASTLLMGSTSPRAAIVGGSLGGLAAANALYQAGWRNIHVYERSKGPMENQGSGLGFVHVPAWEALRSGQPMTRRQRRASREQGSFYYGDLWKYLFAGLPQDTVRFGKSIDHLNITDSSTDPVLVDGNPYDLVILADGGFSKLRNYVLDESACSNHAVVDRHSKFLHVDPDYAGYVVWRGHVTASAVPKDIVRRIREGVYKNGIYDTIVLKMAKDNGDDVWTMGTFIETPEQDLAKIWDKATDGASRQVRDSQPTTTTSDAPLWLRDHFQTYFDNVPGLVALIDCMLEFGDIQPHPQYEFGAIERVHKGRVVLLGDAAHMASPRTAVGAHTAIMDALALKEAFTIENSDIDAAIALYSPSGVRRAHELYARSREVSRQFVSSHKE